MAPSTLNHAFATARFTALTGIPVETTLKNFWPTPGFDAALPRWLESVDPEMVHIIVNSYPACYESVPLRLERRLGKAGAWINGRSQHIASSRFRNSEVFHRVRKLANRTIGGDTMLTVEEHMGYIERTIRAVLQREGAVVAVRGPKMPFGVESKTILARSERRRQRLNSEIESLCGRLHVPVQIFYDPPYEPEVRESVLPDRMHMQEQERKRIGEFEADGMVAAWRAARS